MPAAYFGKLRQLVPDLPAATAFPKLATLWDLDARLKLLDQFGDYSQVLSLASSAERSGGPSNSSGGLASDRTWL